MFGKKRNKVESVPVTVNRVPVYLRAECLGVDCVNFQEQECNSRYELFEASGKSGGRDISPLVEDCSYARYGKICMAGEEQVVVGQMTVSPNGNASSMELVARAGRVSIIGDVLNTPAELVVFAD